MNIDNTLFVYHSMPTSTTAANAATTISTIAATSPVAIGFGSAAVTTHHAPVPSPAPSSAAALVPYFAESLPMQVRLRKRRTNALRWNSGKFEKKNLPNAP